jgi:hypothetical protein
MMQITLEVAWMQGTHERRETVTTGLASVVAFERKYKTSMMALGDPQTKLEYWIFLAWDTLRRQAGELTLAPTNNSAFMDLETFISCCIDVKPVEAVPSFPTEPGAPGDT